MISDDVRARLIIQARNRCGYCHAQQQYTPWRLEIEHIIPQSKGGSDAEENLWLACRSCNSHKSNQTQAIDPVTRESVTLFNPRKQEWYKHFRWSGDGTSVLGITPRGRATVVALKLNNSILVMARQNWVVAGWHPPPIVVVPPNS